MTIVPDPLTVCPVPGCEHPFDVDLEEGPVVLIRRAPELLDAVAAHLRTHSTEALAAGNAVIEDRLATLMMEGGS